MLLGITVSGTFLMPAGVKVPSHFYFSAMPASLLVLVDQRKILFTKNTTSGLNLLF